MNPCRIRIGRGVGVGSQRDSRLIADEPGFRSGMSAGHCIVDGHESACTPTAARRVLAFQQTGIGCSESWTGHGDPRERVFMAYFPTGKRGAVRVGGLTPKQQTMFEIIEAAMLDDGICPSYGELAEILGLSSKSSVHSMLNTLERHGYIRRQRFKPRGIEILKPSTRGDERELSVPQARRYRDMVYDVPVLGSVAAGSPTVEWSTTHSYVSVPAAYARPLGVHFGLHIRGDSMIGAGILDGDMVILRRQNTARSGDYIVALVDGENTLKRLHLDHNRRIVTLMAENPDYENIEIRRQELLIQGRLVSLLRRYAA